MARFCTKCGTPTDETLRFCPKCGNAMAQAAAPSPAAAAPPPAPVPSAPVVAAPVPTAPAPAAPVAAAPGAPAKSGSPILKIVLAVVGVIVLISLLGVGACIFGIYKAKQKMQQFAQEAKVTHSFGTPEVTTEKTPAPSETAPPPVPAVGDLAYPGSTATQSGGSMSFGGIGVSGQEYMTTDPLDKVVSFYKDKLGPNASLMEQGNRAHFTVTGSNGITTVIIEREESEGKTKISISSIKK